MAAIIAVAWKTARRFPLTCAGANGGCAVIYPTLRLAPSAAKSNGLDLTVWGYPHPNPLPEGEGAVWFSVGL